MLSEWKQWAIVHAACQPMRLGESAASATPSPIQATVQAEPGNSWVPGMGAAACPAAMAPALPPPASSLSSVSHDTRTQDTPFLKIELAGEWEGDVAAGGVIGEWGGAIRGSVDNPIAASNSARCESLPVAWAVQVACRLLRGACGGAGYCTRWARGIHRLRAISMCLRSLHWCETAPF
jgi:hypothetical protein